ncbi:uncharacterized protein [Oscarella lobularis]|uniref:uncharacterized protein isoform X2 n=1 Tax=Oscarella lobularis TaxID=121494 RepID=UPI0033136CF9
MISLIPIQAIRPRSRRAPLRAPVMVHNSHLRKPLYGMSIEGSLAIAVREKDGHRIPVQWGRRRRSRDRQTYFPRQAVHRGCTSLCASQTRAPRLHQEAAIRKKLKMLGLDEARIHLPMSATESVVTEILFEAYPLLKETPSFTLMVTDAKKSTRQLIPLSRPYTTKHLQKSCQHQIIYVRPSSSIGSSDSLTSESESDDDDVRNARASRKIIKRELSPERDVVDLTCEEGGTSAAAAERSTDSVSESLAERRQLVQQQDAAYARSLACDEKKDREVEELQLQQKRLLTTAETKQKLARDRRATLTSLVSEEPSDSDYKSVSVKIRMPNGQEIKRRFSGFDDTLQEVLFWASSSGDYDPDDIELLDRMKRGNPKKIPANEYVKPLADVFPKSININLVADERTNESENSSLQQRPLDEVHVAQVSSVTQGFPDLKSIAEHQKSLIESGGDDGENLATVNVRASHLLEDAFYFFSKKKYNPLRPMKIQFVGETAVDSGGCVREFWRRLSVAIMDHHFVGFGNRMRPRKDSKALLGRHFAIIGRILAASLAHEGAGFAFLSDAVYEYVITGDVTDITVTLDDIPEADVQHWIKQIDTSTTDAELQSLFEDLDSDMVKAVCDAGYHEVLASITIKKKEALRHCLLLHFAVLCVKAELDQLRDGLKLMNVLSIMQSHKDIMKKYFVHDEDSALTAEGILKMFATAAFTEKEEDEEKWQQETDAYMLFQRFLDDCEEGKHYCSLSHVLAFFTGSNAIPPTGFRLKPKLHFSHSAIFPQSSICFLTLTLPVQKKGEDAEAYVERLVHAFVNVTHLGQI